LENTTGSTTSLIEVKALQILDEYSGANNYIIKLKQRKDNKKNFYPTRAQSEYIINFHKITPKVAKKWVEMDPYFAKKIADEKLLMLIPERVYVEKLLVEKDKSYHIWGKFLDGEELHDFWLPKGALIKTHTTEKVIIDYSKYSHRPPLEHQKIAIEKLAGSKRFILADDMGLGKCEPKNNKVFTPNGRKKIGDLKVGDKVIGSDGKSHNVIGVYPQGIKETYRITFNDGFSILTGDEHLWSVSSPNYGNNRKNNRIKKSLVLSTKQMYDGGKITIKGDGFNKDKNYEIETYYKSPNGNNKWQIPIVKPIHFESDHELPIDPYLLGLILGDGHITKSSCVFTVHTDDYDELFGSFNLRENKKINNKRKGTKFIGTDILSNLKLSEARSHNKLIPEIYKYTSIKNRLSILQGLMDTDGHCMLGKYNNFNGTEFSTVSKQLCDDVVEIVHSLGGIARVKSRIPTYKYKGQKLKGKVSYRVYIKLPSGMNPFRLKRKSDRYNEPKKYPVGRYIKNIEKVGEDECVCISVDSPDKLYVTEHGIVTHNTTSTIIAALETGAKKILIVCPASLKINWMREISNYTDRSVFISEGKKFSTEHDFVIVNYDILKNFYDLKNPKESKILNNFDLIIADECFTYDTMIMTDIGEIKIGDIVENSLDVNILTYNHQTKKTEYKKIFRWLKKNKDTIYQIKLQNGVFIECTGNHKFYTKNKGYVRADELTTNDDLFELSKGINQKTNLEEKSNLLSILLNKLQIQNESTNKKNKKIQVFQKLSELWGNNVILHRKRNEQPKKLFNKMHGIYESEESRDKEKTKRKYGKIGLEQNNEKCSQKQSKYVKTIFGKNEKKQSDVESGNCGENEKKINWKNISFKRRKWKNNTTTRTFVWSIRRRLDYGITYFNKRICWKTKIFTKLLQSRYWTSNFKNIDRDRWEESHNQKMEIFGQEENRDINIIRVENIKILERGSYDKSNELCSKNTRVYDLEIEGNHNYFVNGVLVSNCHYVSNPQSQRTKIFNDFAKKSKYLWLLSGTPMTNRPMNYFNLLSLIESPVAQNWMAYAIRYCQGYQFKAGNRKVWNVTGASNLEELRDRTSKQFLRRLKTDVLDLPDKIITPVYLRLKSKEYENLMGEYYDWYDKNPNESSSLTVQFSKLMKVRQIIADEKVKNTIELAENIIEQGKKVIIFTNFTDSLNKITEHFGKIAVKLDGSTSKPNRQLAVDQFQENDKIKVFVGNIIAAGVGITLTAAEAVIFNDLSFVPGHHSQAEDRAYRYGQKNSVSIYYPLFENTIEGVIYDMVNEKKKNIETVMGDVINTGDIMEEIMNRINNRR
jgi:intein/homing endonuclease